MANPIVRKLKHHQKVIATMSQKGSPKLLMKRAGEGLVAGVTIRSAGVFATIAKYNCGYPVRLARPLTAESSDSPEVLDAVADRISAQEFQQALKTIDDANS